MSAQTIRYTLHYRAALPVLTQVARALPTRTLRALYLRAQALERDRTYPLGSDGPTVDRYDRASDTALTLHLELQTR